MTVQPDPTRNCRAGGQMARNVDWLLDQPYRCYFYPGRDCPGWSGGGQCSRIGSFIPEDAGTS